MNKNILAYANTTKTELLFLAQFVRSLELGGRCASIVPDGVLFGTSRAHVAIRKEIVDNQQLCAVISMPSGVFKPYAGVSTAVLIFRKTNCGGTDKVWFYDMKADGYSLDDKRTPIADNDIPDVVNRFLHPESENSRTRKDQSFFVPVEEIRQNDYDLSINKYKEIEREKVEYEPVKDILVRLEENEGEFLKGYRDLCKMLEEDERRRNGMRKGWEYKKLGDCTQILDSQRKPVTKRDRKSGIYPYYGATGIQDYVDKYIFDGRYVLVGEDGAKWSSFTQSAFIIEGKTWVNNHAHVLRTNDF